MAEQQKPGTPFTNPYASQKPASPVTPGPVDPTSKPKDKEDKEEKKEKGQKTYFKSSHANFTIIDNKGNKQQFRNHFLTTDDPEFVEYIEENYLDKPNAKIKVEKVDESDYKKSREIKPTSVVIEPLPKTVDPHVKPQTGNPLNPNPGRVSLGNVSPQNPQSYPGKTLPEGESSG